MKFVFTIDAPHFNASGIVEKITVIKAAPIIKYMVGWTYDKVERYCDKKGWRIIWPNEI